MTEQANYFLALSEALKKAGLFHPVLVIDSDRLDANIATAMRGLAPGLALRVVDKSLASIPLLERILTTTKTKRIMSFHLPITVAVLGAFPDIEVLYGKPLPVGELAAWMQRATPEAAVDLIRRTVFLIDGAARLDQYVELARETGQTFRIALETDTGMHRGGFATPAELAAVAARAAQLPDVIIEGLVAYDAHVPELPRLFGGSVEPQLVASRIEDFTCALPGSARKIINTGGSKTVLSYTASGAANDVSIGSAFLKPTDFDVASLSALKPAVFIATPVLKVQKVQLPGPAFLTSLMQTIGLFPRKGCFLYGGKWMAEPVFPNDMKENRVWGLSSNQQMMALPANSTLKPDDFAFFRPTQSEAILQQFGSIHVFCEGRISEAWAALPPG
jgi:D-serine deaminase-like pyridoxal phosphate-dependent protein